MNFTRKDVATQAMAMQYQRIPADQSLFKGHPGFPVAFELNNNEPGQALAKLMANHFSTKVTAQLRDKASEPGVGSYFIDQGQSNNIVVGPTRSGKGQQYIDPFIDIIGRSMMSDSAVIHDPKGELYGTHAAMLQRNGYRVLRLALNGEPTDAFNPLAPIIDAVRRESGSDLSVAADSVARLLQPDTYQDDPYWTNAGRQISRDLLTVFAIDAVFEVTHDGNLVMNDTVPAFGEFMDFLVYQLNQWSRELAGEDADMYFRRDDYLVRSLGYLDPERQSFILSTLDAATNDFQVIAGRAERTFSSIASIMMASISKLNTTLGRQSMRASDIDVNKLISEKTVVFITPNLNTPAYNGVISSFVELAYNAWVTNATTTGIGDKRLYFVLDELGMMAPIDNLPAKMTFSAGLNVSFTLVVQAIDQLFERYGEMAGTILGNANNFAYVGNASHKTVQYVIEELWDLRQWFAPGEVTKAIKMLTFAKHESIVLRKIAPGLAVDAEARPEPILHVYDESFGDGLNMPYFGEFHKTSEERIALTGIDVPLLTSVDFFKARRGNTVDFGGVEYAIDDVTRDLLFGA